MRLIFRPCIIDVILFVFMFLLLLLFLKSIYFSLLSYFKGVNNNEGRTFRNGKLSLGFYLTIRKYPEH